MKKALIIILMLLTFSCKQNNSNERNIKDGNLIITNSITKNNTLHKLNGDWYIWKNELLSYNEVKSKLSENDFSLISLPKLFYRLKPFEDSSNMTTLATIALKINFNNSNEIWSIRLPNASSAESLYINGELYAEIGKVSENKDEVIPSNKLKIVTFKPIKGENILIIHIANFSSPNTGIWDTPTIGTKDDISRKRLLDVVITSLIAGALLFMGLYHISLFILRADDRAPFIFAIICIFMAIRVLITGERILLELFPNSYNGWRVAFTIEYLSAHLTLPLFFSYFKRIFSKYIDDIAIKIVNGVALLWSLLLLFTPVLTSQRFLSMYEYFLLISALYLLIKVIIARKNKENGSITTLIGISVLVATVLNDVLLSNEFILGVFLSPYGVFFYTFSQSFLLSKRFSTLYYKVKNYSDELLHLNTSLQRFIPSEVLKYLKKDSIVDIELGDFSEEDMSVMFLDIRDFTSLSETMSPNDNFRFINSFLKRIGPMIRRSGGFVDKYMGDGIMALFPGKSDNALKAALNIRSVLKHLNKERISYNHRPIKIGIGLTSGTLMLGTIGEIQRMDSTVISDTVNTASRLEELTKKINKDILLSSEIIKKLDNPKEFNITFICKEKLKGKSKTIDIYTLDWAIYDD